MLQAACSAGWALACLEVCLLLARQIDVRRVVERCTLRAQATPVNDDIVAVRVIDERRRAP